jgi:hypothetical protein
MEKQMKKILLTSVALGASAFLAPAAMATSPGSDPSWYCDSLCWGDRVDVRQNLAGMQWAKNLIVDVQDAQDIVQEAVNAGNLIDLEGLGMKLGTIDQFANIQQFSFNLVSAGSDGYGLSDSEFDSIEQAATNVVNSLTGGTALNVHQSVNNNQAAINAILGGSGGYDAELDVNGSVLAATQTAVNASNLVDISAINNEVKQHATGMQVALNGAGFASSVDVTGPYWHPTYTWENADVYDMVQSATNVTNNISIDSVALDGFCACEYELDQYANVGQIAVNALGTLGDVQNITQTATNVANSIARP